MEFETLLAKSYDASNGRVPVYARLLPHLRLVEDSGKAIFVMVGDKILRQANLPIEIWHSRLGRGLTVACLCHDIGKANDGFQKMVRGRISPKIQPVRHELLSALLLAEEGEVKTWAIELLGENGRYDDFQEVLDCVIAAVGGHHRKLDEEWTKASIALRDGGCGQTVRLFLTHENLKPLFGGAVTREIIFDLVPDKELSLTDKRIDFRVSSNRFQETIKNDHAWWRFSAILKALTSAADVVGSALPEKDISPRKWIEINLDQSRFLKTEQANEVVNARLNGNTLRDFQKAVSSSKAKVTLVEAGCGTGKTVAAYAWAANNADGKKLFFCYPTTGTATEGFLGYVAENDVEAELVHSRSSVDIERTFEVADEEREEKQIRIESLKMWFPQVVICTADTVLSLVRNNRRGWYNSPAILSASFVFDELHAYDNRMFAGVIALIKALPNAHFLLMTASLPKARKEFLLKQLGAEDVEQVPTQKDLEELPRYNFKRLTGRDEAFRITERAKTEKLKILWICNTVARTQAVFDELRNRGLPVNTYHSGFKYEDRKARHRQVIDGFDREKSDASLIAATTQVAEMSLDLDADILISEAAPVPSMIQRLGRLNRFINNDNPGLPRIAYFYMPENEHPYGKSAQEAEKIFAQSEQWLSELINLNQERPLRQADL
ncbi:MAG: CRISPR-associated helicase Cas3', partial [Pyrinomonadaceae bacterium]